MTLLIGRKQVLRTKPATILSLLSLLSCYLQTVVADQGITQQPPPINRIAFGSCNVHDKPQPIWQSVIETQPDLWIWLGDAVYADTKIIPFVWSPSPIKIMKEKYEAQRNRSEYKKLLSACPVIGVWDDHDYGKNNGGKEYFNKKESKRVYLEFLDEPKDSIRWQREGIYGSYVYGPKGKSVKVILLDARYFKESEQDIEETRDILGEVQWKWLREELTNSDANIHLIGSGIQVLPYDKPFQEKWNNFPASRKRLFDTIRETGASGVILLSGDVHYAEIFRNNCTGVQYPLYEITSSGLTHSMSTHIPFGLDMFVLNGIMKSKLRVSNVYSGFNFGIIEIDWNEDEEGTKTQIRLQIHDVKGKVVVEEVVPLSSLSPSREYEESVVGECREGEISPKWTRWSLEMWLDYVKYVAVLLFLLIVILVVVVPLLGSFFHNRKKQE